MKHNAFRRVLTRYWLIVLFLIIALFMVIFRVSVNEILEPIKVLTVWQLGALLLVFITTSAFHIYSRSYLLSALGSPCNLKNLVLIHFSTLAAHYSTPAKIGYPLAVYLLNKFENIPYKISSAMILIELLVAASLCGFIAVVGLPQFLGVHESSVVIAVLTGILVLIFLIYIQRITGFDFFPVNLFRKIYTGIINIVHEIRLQHIIVYLLISLLLRILDGINIYLLSVFLGANLTLWQSIIAASTAFFIGAVSMVPMGLGTRDVSILLILQHYGVSDGISLVIMTLQRILSTGLSFMLGLIFGSILGIKNFSVESSSVEKK